MSSPPGDASSNQRPRATIDDIRLAPGGRRDLKRLPRLVRQAFSLVWASAPRQLLAAGGLQVAAGVSLAAQLAVVRRVLDLVVAPGGPPDLRVMTTPLILFGLLLTVVALATVAQREQQRVLGEHVQKYTTDRVLNVSTQVDLIEFDRPSFHDRLQRARVNASIRPLQIANGVIGLLGSGVAVAAVGAALLWIEPLVVALIVVGSIPSILLNRLSSRLTHTFAVHQTPGDRRRAYLYQVLSRKEEAQEIRAFDSAPFLRAEHERLYDARIVALRQMVRRRTLYGLLAGTVAATVTIMAIVMLLHFVHTGRISIGDAAVAVGAVIIIASQVRGLLGSTGSLYEGALFLEDFTDFIETPLPEPPSSAPVVKSAVGFERIDLDHVSFTYPSREEPSLCDVSLSIKQGEVIAFVGENGSGKTTLTKLLAGLYQPTEGSIRWDGIDVRELDLTSVRQQVTLIFQDFARYFLTARENIAISRTEMMDDGQLLHEAAIRAGVDGALSALPDGYDSLLGPSFVGGSDLSMGQWQRIALARAYFRDAPMLILDEPTASLDPRGEYEIFRQVRRLSEGHTVILVSHRFSSVRAADRIIVIDGGRIVEVGNHESLLSEGGLYAELYRLQAEGYRDSPP